MSMQFHIIAGIGIKCAVPLKTVEHEKERCSNENCINHSKTYLSNPFCPICGHKVEKYGEPQPMTDWEVLHAADVEDDTFFIVNGYEDDYFFDNQSKRTNNHFSTYESSKVVTVKEGDVEHQIKIFRAKFEKEIYRIKNYYQYVTVEYFIMSYYN